MNVTLNIHCFLCLTNTFRGRYSEATLFYFGHIISRNEIIFQNDFKSMYDNKNKRARKIVVKHNFQPKAVEMYGDKCLDIETYRRALEF